MPLFFDTNMPIGYIFKWDPWHAYVLNVVEENDSKYWSVTVEKESYKKFKHFRKNYVDLLYLLWHELKRKEGFSSKKNLFKISESYKKLDDKKKRIVFKSIWENEGFSYEESNSKLASTFDSLITNFNIDSETRKKDFRKLVQLHKRTKNYTEIKSQLEKRLHPPDDDIILDAHDLCFKIPDLEIVTADGKLDVDCIKSQTNIKTITFLKDY